MVPALPVDTTAMPGFEEVDSELLIFTYVFNLSDSGLCHVSESMENQRTVILSVILTFSVVVNQ